jgi:hypothetical protein
MDLINEKKTFREWWKLIESKAGQSLSEVWDYMDKVDLDKVRDSQKKIDLVEYLKTIAKLHKRMLDKIVNEAEGEEGRILREQDEKFKQEEKRFNILNSLLDPDWEISDMDDYDKEFEKEFSN